MKWGTVGEGKGDGEGKGGEVSTQATWDQSGRESHHTQKEGFQVSKRDSGKGVQEQGRDFPGKGIIKRITKGIVLCASDNANLVHIVPIVCMSC